MTLGRILFCCVVAVGCEAVVGAEQWPQFRGSTGQGLSDAKNVPVEWSATRNVAWKIDLPGKGWSSPILSDGKLYLTTAIGNPGQGASLRALCVDSADGRVVWNVEVLTAGADQTRLIHQKNSLASATPILSGDRLYVHFGHLGTAALDLSGNVLWRQTGLIYSPVHGNGGSPVLLDDTLIFNCDGASNPFVAALFVSNGLVKWKTPRNTSARAKFSFCTPLVIEVDGKSQVISPGSGFVGAYDPQTGREIWRVRYGEGYSVVPRPVFSHGLLFISSGFDNPVVYAIRPQGASGDVTSTHVAWTHRKGAPQTPSMLALGDELYVVSDAGIATCVDAKTGTVHWTHRFEGGFSASPVAAEGRVYFQNEAGVGYVVKASRKFELLSENDLHERSLASCAVTDGALFIRTESHLWRIGSQQAVR